MRTVMGKQNSNCRVEINNSFRSRDDVKELSSIKVNSDIFVIIDNSSLYKSGCYTFKS
jgi:hypothetical protein